MAVPIIPRVERGRLYFQAADVLFPTFAQAASAWVAAEAHRLDIAEQPELRTQSALRGCDDCALSLGCDVLRALGTSPRWGKQRHSLESRCPAFVAKEGAR